MKKKIAYMLMASLLSVSIAGCAGTSSSSSSSSTSNSTSTGSGDQLLDLYTELAGKANDSISISMWHGFGTGPTPVLETSVADFEELYPMIDVELTSKGGYDNLKKATTLEIPTGNTPNVVLGYPDHFAEYLSGEIMVPLDAYINHANTNIGTNVSDFQSYYMTENRQFVDGVTYGLPFNKSTEVFIYNKTFFDAHALEVPETWDEVRTVSQQILTIVTAVLGQTPDTNGKKIDALSNLDFTGVSLSSFYPMSYDSQSNLFITAIRQWGGVYTERGDDYTQGYIRFDSTTARSALSFFQTMYTDHLFAPPAAWEEPSYASNPFKALKTLMGVSSSAGVYNNVPDAGKFTLGISQIPYKTLADAAVIQQGTNLAVLSNATGLEKLASWLLVRYLTGAGNVDFAMGASYLPARISGVASEDYQAFLDITTGTPADLSKVLSANVASSYLATDRTVEWEAFTDPGFIGSSEIRETIALVIPGITVGGKTIDAQLNDVMNLLPYYIE